MIGKSKRIWLKMMKSVEVTVTGKGRKKEGTEEIQYEWQ